MKKKIIIDDLLSFLDRASIEPQLVWNISHLYTKENFKIQWIHGSEDGPSFFLQKTGQDEWLNLDEKQLLEVLIKEKANLTEFQFELLKTISIQISCSHYYIEKATELIGKDKVKSIVDMTNKIIGSSKDPLEPKVEPKAKPAKLALVDK